ncbi:MAG TPA: MFS transporter [Clostridia bacterium]|nr:MFS transporter [Clostridia bacterium]
MSNGGFSKKEMRFLLGIGAAMGLRQLGLLMVMPFLALYGKELAYSTPGLIGLSLGIYGLSQAVLQVPFGHWSDRWGRKKVILAGLFIFTLGLLLAFLARNIYLFILARLLQGSGAIMSVAYAWVGDRIESSRRNKGMSIIGILVGLSATLAFVGGPVIHRWLEVPRMFLLCAVLAVMAFLYIWLFLADDGKPAGQAGQEEFSFAGLMKDANLVKLFAAGFFNNYLLVSQFYIVPLLLEHSLGSEGMWQVFVPSTLVAILAMRVAAKHADAGRFVETTALSFGAVALGTLAYYIPGTFWVGLGLHLFMAGYMCLTTLLPTAVTKLSGAGYRGKVTGVFNTWQFIGSFVGGSLTGILWGVHPAYAILLVAAVAAAGVLVVRKVPAAPLQGEEPLVS